MFFSWNYIWFFACSTHFPNTCSGTAIQAFRNSTRNDAVWTSHTVTTPLELWVLDTSIQTASLAVISGLSRQGLYFFSIMWPVQYRACARASVAAVRVKDKAGTSIHASPSRLYQCVGSNICFIFPWFWLFVFLCVVTVHSIKTGNTKQRIEHHETRQQAIWPHTHGCRALKAIWPLLIVL